MSDMGPDLSPSARALLDAARPDISPDPAAIRRMRAGVAAKVGGGFLAGSLAAKIGLAALIVTAGVGSLVYATRDSSSEKASAPALQAPAVNEPSADPTPTPVLPPPASRAHATVTLEREVELVDSAMAAVAARDGSKALSILAMYATETQGAGQLAEDAAAIEAEATCSLDTTSATRVLAAFDARYPQSAQRARITAACSSPK